MNGVIPSGATEPLVVKVAEEHGKMKAAYYAGYHAGLSLRGACELCRMLMNVSLMQGQHDICYYKKKKLLFMLKANLQLQ